MILNLQPFVITVIQIMYDDDQAVFFWNVDLTCRYVFTNTPPRSPTL